MRLSNLLSKSTHHSSRSQQMMVGSTADTVSRTTSSSRSCRTTSGSSNNDSSSYRSFGRSATKYLSMTDDCDAEQQQQQRAGEAKRDDKPNGDDVPLMLPKEDETINRILVGAC